jgi:cytoskeletal protein CcmA (bactofilin family)
MWRKEDAGPQTFPEVSQPSGAKAGTSSTPPVSGKAAACISHGIKIKGEVAGTEDLFVDGVVDGKITLANSSLTVGPNGTARAEITAREIVLRGVAEGKFTAEERIQIWHTARVQGDLKSERISIEDGAELRGKVEAGKVTKSCEEEPEARNKKTDNKATEMTGKDTSKMPGAATAGAD